MSFVYEKGQKVYFQGIDAVIETIISVKDDVKYLCRVSGAALPMLLSHSQITLNKTQHDLFFNKKAPHFLAVDEFYKDPDFIRALALQQDFEPNTRWYKGLRTKSRFLWPWLKEEFERLLGVEITDWLNQIANGCFQMTGYNDPLVWHSDSQTYAAAIYLTPDAPVGSGTSFWRDKKYFCRRPPTHELEIQKFKSEDDVRTADSEIYNQYNILHGDNWELVDRVGAIYNRLVIWDAKIIHSASSYEGLVSDDPKKSRLVQLFFFNIRK